MEAREHYTKRPAVVPQHFLIIQVGESTERKVNLVARGNDHEMRKRKEGEIHPYRLKND